MRVALLYGMFFDKSGARYILRLICLVVVMHCTSHRASADVLEIDDRALVLAEARLSYGVAMGGGVGGGTAKGTPVGLELIGESAIIEEPWTSLYGGALFESFGRNSVGAVIGARFRPDNSALRISVGLIGIAVPTRLAGASFMLGSCLPLGGMALCGDLEAVAFVAGKDLPEGRVATQLKLGAALAVAIW